MSSQHVSAPYVTIFFHIRTVHLDIIKVFFIHQLIHKWIVLKTVLKFTLKLHYATNRQVAGSIPGGAIGIFQWHNPSGRTMALGSTQPLTEMSTRCISWGGKDGRCVRLTTLPSSCVVMKSRKFNFLEPSGPLQACNGTALPLPAYIKLYIKTAPTCLGAVTPSSGSALFVLVKVTVVKIAN